jgi:hypothetical protein
MSRYWGGGHVHLSTHKFVALAIAGKLAKLLKGQLGNYFRAHGQDYTAQQDPLTLRATSPEIACGNEEDATLLW